MTERKCECGGSIVRRSTPYSSDYFECSECSSDFTWKYAPKEIPKDSGFHRIPAEKITQSEFENMYNTGPQCQERDDCIKRSKAECEWCQSPVPDELTALRAEHNAWNIFVKGGRQWAHLIKFEQAHDYSKRIKNGY